MTDSPFFWRRVLPPLPIAKRLGLVVCGMCVYALGVELLIVCFALENWKTNWGVEATVLQGLIVGLLLVFRNNEASKRWYEARQLWGQLVNHTRNLCLKVRAHVALEDGERHKLATLLAGFPVALMRHLRGEGRLQDVPGFAAAAEQPGHVPAHLAGLLQQQLAGWQRAGRIDGLGLLYLDTHAAALMDICGGCERIRHSPVPASYRALLRHGTWLFLLLIPWYLDPELGWWGIPVIGLVTYFLYGVELTAEVVEEPFGKEADDLSLDTLCQTIQTSVGTILSDA